MNNLLARWLFQFITMLGMLLLCNILTGLSINKGVPWFLAGMITLAVQIKFHENQIKNKKP